MRYEPSKITTAAVLSFVVFLSIFFIAYGIATLFCKTLSDLVLTLFLSSLLCLFGSFGFGYIVLWFLNLSPPIPTSWLYAATLGALLESVAFGLTPLNSIHFWFLLPWGMTLASPFVIYPMKLGELREMHSFKEGLMDKDVLDVARKYGGIITLSIIVWELKVSLEAAQKSLERFVKHGEAIRKKVDSLLIYDFQSARIHLARSDNLVVEALRDNPFGLSRSELISQTGMAIEVLDESIKRLEDLKIIYQDMVTDKYKLRSYSLPTAT